MITDSYDNKTKPLIRPEDLYKKADRNNKVCIVTYSGRLFKYVKEHYDLKEEIVYKTTGGDFFVYSFNFEGQDILFYQSFIGAAVASTLMAEISNITGCHHFIFFGSCGVLNEEKCRGKVIVPTASYRDEGISYHYAPASDYIDIKNHSVISSFLKENNINYVEGKVWTTDAFYMETLSKLEKRKKDDNLAVEMEVSGVEAVARFYDVENYHILFPADSLESEEWSREDFGGDKELELQVRSFLVASKFALSLIK